MAKLEVEYRHSADGLTEDHLHGFFVGWPHAPSASTHLELLNQSDYVCIAVVPDDGRVIGFITAISDGVLMAYIPLLEVLPAYQRRGIGSELVKRMFQRLSHLYGIDVVCDAELRPFWERFEMQQAAGMVLRRRDVLWQGARSS